jgi:hypothetical protein
VNRSRQSDRTPGQSNCLEVSNIGDFGA